MVVTMYRDLAPKLGVHRIHNFAIRPDPDLYRILTCQIRIQTWPISHGSEVGSTTTDNRIKITLSAPQLEETGMTVYSVLW